MSIWVAAARLEAAERRIAEPIAAYHHRRLTDRPLVIIPLFLTGEASAPLAVAIGSARSERQILTVPQPRSLQQRDVLVTRLAQIIMAYVDAHTSARSTRVDTKGKEHSWYTNAPQIIVPNPAGITALAHIGRMTRFSRVDGPYALDPIVPRCGCWLTFFADRGEQAGSALLTSATDLLCEQWATGQSPEEDTSLPALLAWIDPPEGFDALEAARTTEDPLLVPPAGPATDPGFDNAHLEGAMSAYDKAHRADDQRAQREAVERLTDALTTQLAPTWESVWNAISLLRALPEAPSAAARWLTDCEAFTTYSDYLESGGLPQPRRDSPRAAAERLARLEQAQTEYDARRALEDPMILAERRCEGEAFTGTVTTREPDRTETSGKNRTVLRPRFTLTTQDPLRLGSGSGLLASPGMPQGHRAKIIAIAADKGVSTVTLEVTKGMGTPKKPTPGTVPDIGREVSYTLAPDYRPTPKFPPAEQTPWTHRHPDPAHENRPEDEQL
jgi:hypothetical protein